MMLELLKMTMLKTLKDAEMGMVRWMSYATVQNGLTSVELRRDLEFKCISEEIKASKLHWFSYVVKKDNMVNFV